ncbi:MAG: hypothetical protein GXO26_05375 [Crenarchaeota archaeon]|nr:hypothetical protein [Thermoproteota archaeon]
MRYFYIIGKIVKYDEENLEATVETLISPIHRPSEHVSIRIKEPSHRDKIREGNIVIAKVTATRRLIVYDIKRLEAHEIHVVSGEALAELAEELTHHMRRTRHEIPIK